MATPVLSKTASPIGFEVVFKSKFDNDIVVLVKESFKTFGDIHKQLNVQQGRTYDNHFCLHDLRRINLKTLTEDDFIKDNQTIEELGLKHGTKIFVLPKNYKK